MNELENALKTLLTKYTKYEIKNAIERLSADQSLDEIREMKHVTRYEYENDK